MADKEEQGPQLKRGAVGLWHGVFQSFSFVAPAGDVAVLLIGTVAFAGSATTLAVLLAWLIYGLWMNTPYQFAKIKANAGSYYAYSAEGSKSRWLAPVTLFTWMSENLTGPSFGILGLAGFVFLLSSTLSSIPYLWVVFATVITAYMGVLSYLGIRPSLNYVMYTGFAEAGFLLLGAIIIIADLGHQNTLSVLTIPRGALSAVLFGVIFSILDFTGLGTVTTVSEEISEAKKVVRKALVYAFLLSGIALIIPAYALTVGWGLGNISAYANSPDPGLVVFGKFLGPVGLVLLVIFTINSYFSYGVAKANAVSRIWYSAARDGIILPKWFSHVHPKHRTPSHALLGWLAITYALSIIFGILYGPVNGALVLLTVSGIGIIFVHVFANSALTAYALRTGKFDALAHGIVPIASSILALIVVYYSVESTLSSALSSPSLLNYGYIGATIGGLVWVAVGLAISAYYVRRKPDILARAGKFDAEA